MASAYDALLEPPKSEYDSLLEPDKSPYDSLLEPAVEKKSPQKTLSSALAPVIPEIAQAEEQQAMERNAAFPKWANDAAEEGIKAIKALVPESVRNDPMGLITLGENTPTQLRDILGMFSPANAAIDDLKKTYEVGKDVLTTDASFEEATRKHSPESFALADADKTPALSRERFAAGFGTLTQILMAAGIVKGLKRPIPEPVRPQEAPSVPKATDTGAALVKPQETAPIEQVPMAEVLKPEVAPTAETPLAPEQTTVQGQAALPPHISDLIESANAKTPLQSARANTLLEASRNNLDARLDNGATLEVADVTDTAKQKALQQERDRLAGNYPLGNPTHPDTVRFRQLQEQLKSPITKQEYRLTNPDGSFKVINKTEAEYVAKTIGDRGASSSGSAQRGITSGQPPVESGKIGIEQPVRSENIVGENAGSRGERQAPVEAARGGVEPPSVPSVPENQIAAPVSPKEISPAPAEGRTQGVSVDTGAETTLAEGITHDSLPETVGPNVKGFDKIYGPGEIEPGKSITPEKLLSQGQSDLAAGKDPYSIADRARTGDVSPRELGMLAAEHQRLVNEAAAAEGMPDYEAKYQQARDFAQNMLKPAGTKWHQTGMGLQIEVPVDLSNVTGFRAAFEERFNREISPEEAQKSFGKVAQDVARAKAEDLTTLQRTGERVQQRFKGVKDVPFEDAVKELNDTITKALRDCVL